MQRQYTKKNDVLSNGGIVLIHFPDISSVQANMIFFEFFALVLNQIS